MAGKRIFLIEDEPFVLFDLEDMAQELGYDIADTATSLEMAERKLAEGLQFDLAVLDVNLNGRTSYPIADKLIEKGTPFVFATGYGTNGLDERYKSCPIVQKPYNLGALKAVLSSLSTTGT